MNPTLVAEGLSGGYERVRVFRDIGFVIAARESVGILGPNGSGRTTLLMTLTGILPAFSGRITLDGRDVTKMAAHRRVRRGIGHVPEGRQVLSTLTVRDNLDLAQAAKPRTETRAQFKKRMDEVFDLFPRLKERVAQPAGTLSGGEQQMLAIGRALLINPKLLMLDEPTQGLAPVIVRELEGALLQLKGRFSMIVVEQNRSFLDAITDRMFHMAAGRCTEMPKSGIVGGTHISQ
jgi:branched-chain amino acid transport system ATP-binding protein